MGRGGKRSGAGRKRIWNSGPADKAIKVPMALAAEVLAFARAIDINLSITAKPLSARASEQPKPLLGVVEEA